MKIVIDIPDEGYDWIKNGFPDNEDKEFLIKAIKNGKPYNKDEVYKDGYLKGYQDGAVFD